MKETVKMKTVVGYPEEMISTLTDLILDGEVNVVLFNDYGKFFTPQELEEKLSQKVNISNGWETEYFYKDDVRSGLKFHRQGETRIEDCDVVDFLEKNEVDNIPLIFPEGVEDQIEVVVKNYVRDILPGLMKEGLSLEDIIEDKDSMWDYVVEMTSDFDKDVQDLFNTYMDKNDMTIWSYTYQEMKNRFVMDMTLCEVEC